MTSKTSETSETSETSKTRKTRKASKPGQYSNGQKIDSGKKQRKQTARSRKRPYVVKTLKRERLFIRTTAFEKSIILEAAKLQGYSIVDFIVRQSFLNAKKFLQAKGYKISKKHNVNRGIDLFLKTDRIMYSSVRSSEQVQAVLNLTADEVEISAGRVQKSVIYCPNCDHEF